LPCFAVVLLIVVAVQTIWVSPRDVAYHFAAPGVPNGACERHPSDPQLLVRFGNSKTAADARLLRNVSRGRRFV
jgi:hypothetical protein